MLISRFLLFIVLLSGIGFTTPRVALSSPDSATVTTALSAKAEASEYELVLQQAIAEFYATNWGKASALLNQLKRKNSDDPRSYFFEAMIPFWDYFFGASTSSQAERFLELSQAAIIVAERRLEVSASDTSTILLLSGLHGYRSLVAAQEKKYRTAMSSGVTGYSYTKQMLAMDNDDPNTLMGQGVFQYMVGSIPSEVRWLARLAGLSGDKQKGYEILEKAAESESYVSYDARMFLAYFYEKDERYNDALRHMEHLTLAHPKNVIFQYNYARLLESMSRPREAYLAYENLLKLPSGQLYPLHNLSRERMQAIRSNGFRTVAYP